MKNNKKGFTLIELLAVIVILAILVMLAIPAVTRYLTAARKNAFSDNALRAVEAVRNDVVISGFAKTRNVEGSSLNCTGAICYYDLQAINDLLETKLTTSPFGGDYETSPANVCITVNQAQNTYTVTMVDSGGNGFVSKEAGSNEVDENNKFKGINADVVDNTGTQDGSSDTCGKTTSP